MPAVPESEIFKVIFWPLKNITYGRFRFNPTTRFGKGETADFPRF